MKQPSVAYNAGATLYTSQPREIQRPTIPFARALGYAQKLVEWLRPFCERLEIAGSIRREREYVNDVDIVCIPKRTVEHDLFGQETGAAKNHVLDMVREYVAGFAGTVPRPGEEARRIICGGEREGKQLIVQLPKVQLDLWFADERTFGTRLMCRTGSREHNIWLATRAEVRGLKWNPYEGLHVENPELWRSNVDPTQARTEREIYAMLGVKFIPPTCRELEWLSKNIDSGLEPDL